MQYENVTQKVLIGNGLLAALRMGENLTSYHKIVTVRERAMCVLWFFEPKSVITMQNHYKLHFQIMISDVG
jgi:hypothetical protein